MLFNTMSQTNKEVCKAYQQRKRERDAAAARRRTAARVRRQSKREASPANPAGELVEWCERRLKVPAGHALAGQAMALPKFAVDFLRDALRPDCHTGWLLVPRKNGKSQALASLVLGYLADGAPLCRAGFRCAIVSVTKPKAAELKKLAQGHGGGVRIARAVIPQVTRTWAHRIPLGYLRDPFGSRLRGSRERVRSCRAR